MSSRQLRKLQQQKELEQAARRAEEETQEEESEEEPSKTPPKSKPSLFANLAALEGEDDADEEKEESEPEALSEPEPVTPASRPKKSKKKKKGKNKAKETPVKKEPAIDDIDQALKELDIQQPTGESWHNSKPTFDPQYEKICELVRIQTQHLKVGNEMRNLFGRAATENHDDAGGPVGRGARRQPQRGQPVDLETALKGHHLPGKGLPEITLRRNIFVQGKDDWPKGTTSGLTMEMVDDLRQIDGTVEFRFVHDKTYQAVQQTFHGLVEMGDPQNLIGLLTRNPYHISTLLQVSKIAKDQTDHALSSDLLERALFTFARASLSLFSTKLAEGKARLDFSRPENRELWLAGWHYIKSLIMKGTYRTALEWAKLLLSLDPEEDPYCMRLLIHHLALRAHEFKWLLEMGDFAASQDELPEDDRLVQVAAYPVYHNTPSLALAAMHMKDGMKARELLTRSMLRLPWLFVQLMKDLDLVAPPSIWGNQPRTDAETLFTSLYVQQTKDLWNTTEGTALLMEIAHTIPKVSTIAVPMTSNDLMNRNVVRFVYLDNTPALMALVPSHILHMSDNSDSDPIPPNHSTYSYHIQKTQREGGHGNESQIAAIARMLFARAGEDGDDSDHQREIDDIIRNGIEDPPSSDSDDDNDAPHQPSMANRLLSFIFNTRQRQRAGEEDVTEDDTDTDEMPDLIPHIRYPREEEEDEMPELEPAAEHRFGHVDETELDTDDEMPPRLTIYPPSTSSSSCHTRDSTSCSIPAHESSDHTTS